MQGCFYKCGCFCILAVILLLLIRSSTTVSCLRWLIVGQPCWIRARCIRREMGRRQGWRGSNFRSREFIVERLFLVFMRGASECNNGKGGGHGHGVCRATDN